MSNILKIYREHALELLYQPQTPLDVNYKPRSSTYLDLQVLSQNHPGFPLYLLMSAPQFYQVYTLIYE